MTAAPAVVLLSGGLDSATVLAIATYTGYAVHALTFDYGQRHLSEIAAARQVAAAAGVTAHELINIDPALFGATPLTSSAVPVPHHGTPAGIPAGIAPTYIPARNTIFLSYALAWAERIGAKDVFVGATLEDQNGYPDCRPEYLRAFERVGRLGTRIGAGLLVHAPLIGLTKGRVIRLGLSYGVDYALTRSCYDPPAGKVACGSCDACLVRAAGFTAAGIPDPAQVTA